MIGWPRFSSDIFLISWRMIDMIFPFVDFAALWGGLLEWKHDDRAGCLASADELVRGCSVPKRKRFDNVACYDSLSDGLEKGFCSGVDFASVRQVMRKGGAGDDERPANAQIFDQVDWVRNAGRVDVSGTHSHQPHACER